MCNEKCSIFSNSNIPFAIFISKHVNAVIHNCNRKRYIEKKYKIYCIKSIKNYLMDARHAWSVYLGKSRREESVCRTWSDKREGGGSFQGVGRRKRSSLVRRNANSDNEGAKRGGEDARSRVRPANFDDHRDFGVAVHIIAVLRIPAAR